MSSETLFDKLPKYEIELRRLEKQEDQDKKPKSISLRLESKEAMIYDSSYQDENIILLVKKFGKFLQNDKTIKFGKRRILFKKKEASTSNRNFTCFKCGMQGHMKADCPYLAM